jgi:hypothetical protein
MNQDQLLAWVLLYTLFVAIVFYSLGVAAGRKDGYFRGRAVGMRIGRERQVSK